MDVVGDFFGIVVGGGDYLVSFGFNLFEFDCGLDDLDIVLVLGYNLGVVFFISLWLVVLVDFNLSNFISFFD